MTANVTERNPPASTGVSERAPAEREMAAEASSLQPEGVTFGERLRGWVTRSRTYWTPPTVLTDAPRSYAELMAYARYGAWSSRVDDPRRVLAVLWVWGVALLPTVTCRYVEWIIQRPGRAIPIYGVWKLCSLTGPGQAIVDDLIRPTLAFLAWVLL